MEKFIEILERLDSKLLELKEVLSGKQAALVHGKHTEVGEFLSQEQTLLALIATLENERLEELQMVKAKYSIEDETNKMDDLILLLQPLLSDEEFARLVYLRTTVRNNTKIVKRINEQNGELVNNVRQFIKVLFTNIRGTQNSCLINARV